ncbi:MAG: DUF896 domain-containing protein [Clostridia bacterium]
MEHEQIERINELARLSRQRELTGQEQSERDSLRKEYIAAFRQNTQAVLNSVRVEQPDGTLSPLQKKEDKP